MLPRLSLFLIAILLFPAGAGPAGAAKSAQLVFQGGIVHTGDPTAPVASALAVRDGKILYVGDDAGVRDHIGKKTRIVNLGQKALFPGFVDHWFRSLDYAAAGAMVDFSGASSFQDMTRLVSRAARRVSPNAWVIGRGWDNMTWSDPTLRISEMTSASGRHPLCLFHATDDAVFVSISALVLAGIDTDYPDPPGGRLVRDSRGNLTGVLTDRAADVVRLLIPRPDLDETTELLRAAADSAAAQGITTICDPSVTREVLAALERIGSGQEVLPVRFEGAYSGSWTEIRPLVSRGPLELGGGRIRIRAIAVPLDGGFNTGGAALNTPYQDEGYNSGVLQYTSDELAALIEAGAGVGQSVWISATGNRAVSTAVRALEQALGNETVRSTAPRMIGVDLVDPDDVERLRGTGASVTILPERWAGTKAWLARRIGTLSADAYDWAGLAEAGVPLLLGSGAPSAALAPLRHFALAVRSPHGLTRDEALGALTGGAVLKPGGAADFTVISGDILTLDGADLDAARAEYTVVDGLIVYDRAETP